MEFGRLDVGLLRIFPELGYRAGFWPAKYFLRLDVDAPDEASRLASYSLPHYPKLKIVALVGLAISLLRLMAAFFGADWPGRWMGWVLVLAGIGLAARTDGRLNWEAVPHWLRAVMKAAGGTVFMILLLLFAWSHLFQHRASFPDRR